MSYMRVLIVLSALATLTACTTYYEVTDPTTNKVYYSTEIDRGREGSVTLTDSGSGAEVTIQNSEIREVSKDVFQANAYATIAPAAGTPAEADSAQ